MAETSLNDDPQQTLVLQEGRKINDEYYIVGVFENQETNQVTFAAFELENSGSYQITFTMSQFEELFANDPELRASKNRDQRYHWIIVRLDFASDGTGGRKLVLGATPSPEEEEIGVPSSLGTGRMTYAERQRLRYETERLDEKRAQNIAAKSDKARKAFLMELQERRKMEQLKAAARQKSIEEERAERREQAVLEKRLKEERLQLYKQNDEKRTRAITTLETDRARRDEQRIRGLIEEDKRRKLERKILIDEAKPRKRDQLEAKRVQEKEQAARLATLDNRRDEAIYRRKLAHMEREKRYLQSRQQAIDELSKQKQLKAERKAQYLYSKSAERAKRLKEEHEKAAEWERLEDQRTQAELKREHDRNMMMLVRIEELKSNKEAADMELKARKEAALERRRIQDKQHLDSVAQEAKRVQELEEKRARQIATREATRDSRNQEYVQKILDQKAAAASRAKEKAKQLSSTRDKTRDDQAEKRRQRMEEELRLADLARRRENAIGEREKKRDQGELAKVKEWKEQQDKKHLELEAAKMQKRLQEKEQAQRQQEESAEKTKQWQALEAKRVQSQDQKEIDRSKRENQRREVMAGKSGYN